MIISVASGKGGTGKTTVSVNLARVSPAPVQLLDCDVEEPNCHLFLGGELKDRDVVTMPVPEVDVALCNGCGACSAICEFNAIAALKDEALVFEELCHGCGGCTLVCPTKAITEKDRRIGEVEVIQAGHISLVQGRIDVGVAMAPPVIRAVKERLDGQGMAILDAPPGTSCPVIATIKDTDLVILVTEPTPFGLHDLSLAVDMVRELAVPFGVIVNRVGIGDNRVHAFCRDEGVPIFMEIPDDRRIAEAYSRGELMVDALPEYRDLFGRLLATVKGYDKQARRATHADL
ncbi:MAG TPA: ATP-binding protein [Deltaproteobacteria bacterium]|nr:ATP-binding protein [Deltaproteobacteria bacterium]OQC29056.1 MAG: Anaerobic sulfite reductase subunit C [Deltaproteobacteria bacterium ADurb.Bin072]HNQ84625.1 ATP-binding protein [Deltaproteobacteria bacterium]HNS88545.1 ATP-binding protein [Deltaproteobacteria bacterium]HOA43449.1 ATP-binding protein [Deltaproteobacteria bacterium]